MCQCKEVASRSYIISIAPLFYLFYLFKFHFNYTLSSFLYIIIHSLKVFLYSNYLNIFYLFTLLAAYYVALVLCLAAFSRPRPGSSLDLHLILTTTVLGRT